LEDLFIQYSVLASGGSYRAASGISPIAPHRQIANFGLIGIGRPLLRLPERLFARPVLAFLQPEKQKSPAADRPPGDLVF
jgi:hypothetical protein